MSVTFEPCLLLCRRCRGVLHQAFVRGSVFYFCAFALPLHCQEHKPIFIGAPMSMNFQNIEVRTALQILADFTGLNIITSDSVTGALTLKLNKVEDSLAKQLSMMCEARKGNSIQTTLNHHFSY